MEERQRKGGGIKYAHPRVLTFPRFTAARQEPLESGYMYRDRCSDGVLRYRTDICKVLTDLGAGEKYEGERKLLRRFNNRLIGTPDAQWSICSGSRHVLQHDDIGPVTSK